MRSASLRQLAAALGLNRKTLRCRRISGASLAHTYRISDDQRHCFVKCLGSGEADRLDAERQGLTLLAQAQAFATPRVLAHGQVDDWAWLALDWVDLEPLSAPASAQLGVQLVKLHETRATRFGLDTDNFIGPTQQINRQESDWTTFFFQHRIGVQLGLLERKQAEGDWLTPLDRLQRLWTERFEDYQPRPSLLHGDLWSGNAGMTASGLPILFDPAVHYGDRECDLAMAALFGGFSTSFFDAYTEVWPLPSGWRLRRRYYQLYHLLNHANVFGGHYLQASRTLISRLLSLRSCS
ncbi:MAG: fructosamine kinase family protein [Pseudomonadota bacterium]